ncbi:LUD domain-containing protein [Flavivirga aquimarina]|uniref:LUD domain-containing protein n=1 Tax=Flavivirga aquimarina TaxID=2027862 RepID=A0ABT8W743_9FLAO|nr:LUD domain-containing protein [Flavivirga aquimarina]MDO5968929.1 LUD domain-containing protein [Flavivirga aquimarina]
MSSRDSILKAVKNNKPELLPLPEIDLDVFNEDINLLETFIKSVELVGGRAKVLNSISDLDNEIKALYPNAKQIVSSVKESDFGTVSISKDTDPHSLETIDLAIIQGEFGVAENGAVWISENDFSIRVLPFITNDLILVISKDAICLHLHDAYKLISKRERTFGLFVAGPSKTADIEQCLVIGAHGAVSLTVMVV